MAENDVDAIDPTETPFDATNTEGAVEQEVPVACDDALEAEGEPAEEAAEEAEHEPTEEELAAAEAERLAAEKAAREAAERAERMAAEKEAAEAASAAAVETLSTGAGFVTRAGVYYDLDAPKRVEFQYADLTQRQNEKAVDEAASEGDAELATEEGADAKVDDESAPEEQCDEPDEGNYVDPADFAKRVARLTDSVVKQSLHREIYYKTLVYCQESHVLQDIEQKIATFSEFKRAAASQYHFIKVLEKAGGLQRFELDEQGEVILPEQKVGLTEDEVDDLVANYAFMTTDVGMAVVEQHTPRARIIELLGLVPERRDAYIELMDFVSEDPRTYNEISQLFQGRDVLYRIGPDGEPQKMQPSVFVDKLEAAGGIEYRDGWVLTEEGKGFLDELRGTQEQ